MSTQDKQLKVAIKTFGCQMNVYDTQVAEGFLKMAGHEICREHEDEGDGTPDKSAVPDVVLMNTCSVREHAEERVYGRLGMLGKAKKTNPNLIIGLMGCMVEEHQEKLFKRFPQLDLMIGTRNIRELPALIENVTKKREQVARIKKDGLSIEYSELINRSDPYHAWLPIMTGCNKVCTFCIVPITRGSEVSMPARDVYREASRLVSEGVKWITLLGQNVNSYRAGTVLSGTGPNQFPELLDMLCQIDGLERISFTTSHPHDATEELYRVISRNPKISRRFHLPLQSGSDRILKRMKRLHTYEEYKAKIDRMRELISDIAVTTDIITGFSRETEEDHILTRQALQEIRYDSAFIYKYSLRPGTPAAKLPDDVPQAVKEQRHRELLELQKEITDDCNHKRIGITVNAFVEGKNPRNASEMIGRTDQDKKVVFKGGNHLKGSFARVMIMDLKRETFIGDLCG